MGRFNLKLNDTQPALLVQLENANGTNPNLTGGSCQLNILRNDGTALQRAMTLSSSTGGVVSYNWQTSDYSTGNADGYLFAGLHDMEYQATLSSGAVITYPNDSYDELDIEEDLD